jgi:hypothetical protein
MSKSVGAAEDAIAPALTLAAEAERWDVVAQLARELEARRLTSSNVAPLDTRRPVRRPQ